MDLRAFYKQIREVEKTISAPFVVLVGLDTPDGGKSGLCSEVTRHVAARLIIEGRGRLASDEESAGFYERQSEARKEAEAVEAAQRMQVMIVPNTEHRNRVKSSRE